MRKRGRMRLMVLLLVVSLACLLVVSLTCRTCSQVSSFWGSLHWTRPPLAFSPLELPEARLGHPYEVTITISGNETPVFLISVDSGELPPGLILHYEEWDDIDGRTSRIEGVPEKAGEFEFVVSAQCRATYFSGQTGEQRYTLLVREE